MRVVDMMHEDGRVFLKSEWGQIGNDWPCVSFTKSSVGEFLRANFRPKRDILIYVGTTNAEMTENHDHRSRLISTVSIEPNQLLSTKKMIPADVWARSTAKWGDRWPHAMAVLNAANFFGPPFPYAREVIPSAYASLGQLTHRGGVAEVFSLERKALMGLAVQGVELTLHRDVIEYMHLRSGIDAGTDKYVNEEATRMANLIIERVKRGGEQSTRINPCRHAPNFFDLYNLILKKWQADQRGLCALCQGKLIATMNPILQPSVDRKDSNNIAYDAENLQVTPSRVQSRKKQIWLRSFRGVVIYTARC
jgi:hypothetical protein